MSKILIVDDDKSLLASVDEVLAGHGYLVDKAEDPRLADEMLKASPYDLLILDWNLPQMTGIEFLKRIRTAGIQSPVLMLTGMDHIDNKETGLNSGADDYLTKPFNSRELVARVRALLRRPSVVVDTSDLEMNGVYLSTKTLQVKFHGNDLKLTKQEFHLLEFLMRNKDQVFNSEMLVERAWSTMAESSPDTVRVHLSRLRKKMEATGHPCPFRTVFGQGYAFMSVPSEGDKT
ncbi:MAG: response regulator transcription factor [Candidatus Obscuribacterales bacterium]|nr:response regulator transcription factor [Candidatus Obscuribacterales bacterium]